MLTPGESSLPLLDRVLAALARRALRRPGVRSLLDLDREERREADAVYVRTADGGWRHVATASAETSAPRWRPAPFWERQRVAPSPWTRVVPPSDSPGGFRRLP